MLENSREKGKPSSNWSLLFAIADVSPVSPIPASIWATGTLPLPHSGGTEVSARKVDGVPLLESEGELFSGRLQKHTGVGGGGGGGTGARIPLCVCVLWNPGVQHSF